MGYWPVADGAIGMWPNGIGLLPMGAIGLWPMGLLACGPMGLMGNCDVISQLNLYHTFGFGTYWSIAMGLLPYSRRPIVYRLQHDLSPIAYHLWPIAYSMIYRQWSIVTGFMAYSRWVGCVRGLSDLCPRQCVCI